MGPWNGAAGKSQRDRQCRTIRLYVFLLRRRDRFLPRDMGRSFHRCFRSTSKRFSQRCWELSRGTAVYPNQTTRTKQDLLAHEDSKPDAVFQLSRLATFDNIPRQHITVQERDDCPKISERNDRRDPRDAQGATCWNGSLSSTPAKSW